MRKNYILTCVILLMGVLATAQTTNEKPTFIVTEISTPGSEEGVIYTQTNGEAQIEVKLRNVTAREWPGSFSISCLEGTNSFYNYPYFEMVGENNSGNESTDHSFVEIHNLGSANIERVEFAMGSTGTSYLVCSASIDGTDYFNSDYETPEGSVYKRITVEGLTDICKPLYSYDVPDEIEDVFGDGTVITEAREKLKYVRLNWGKSFAGAPTPDKKNTTNIFAIQVYMDADITVSLEDEPTASDRIQLFGRNLQLGESSDVTIYEITGKVAAEYHSIQDAYLDMLNAGVYIIKAKTANGVETTQKVVIR